ncbi:MAG: hypothetical protein ACO1OO_04225 [Flavisolibacter sp.]
MRSISPRALPLIFCLLVGIPRGFSQDKIKGELRQKAEETGAVLSVPTPDYRSPVSLNATTVWSRDKKQLAVILKAAMLEGWHIYAHVPDDQPYIQSELRLRVPDSLTPLEKWELPVPYPYADGIFVYKGSSVFIRYFSVKDPLQAQFLEVGLYYQTCNLSECLPPEEEILQVPL